MKIKVYLDTGANDKKLIKACNIIGSCYQFPYDSSARPKDILVAVPSLARWEDGNASGEELEHFCWEDFSKSELLPHIRQIIGSSQRRDALHLDSAYKTKCQAFVTSDKDHIYKNKEELEKLLGLKIFYYPTEVKNLIDYLKTIKSGGSEGNSIHVG